MKITYATVACLYFCLLCGPLFSGDRSSSAAAPSAGATAASDSLPVFFTGRLFGYFRDPDRQMWDTAADTSPRSPQVQTFLDELRSLGGAERAVRLLVGMGDNFSPDLLSRFVYQGIQPVRKDVLAWDRYATEKGTWVDLRSSELSADASRDQDQGRGIIPADNVAGFLQLAGYDAVVPGKHDFYFGPERLRQLAYLLANRKDPTMMLGANLALATTMSKPTEAPPDRSKLKLDTPDVIFPWMRSFVVRSAYQPKTGQTALSDFSPRAIIAKVMIRADGSGAELSILDGGPPQPVQIEWLVRNACLDPKDSKTSAPCTGTPLDVDVDALTGRHPDGSVPFSLKKPPSGEGVTWLTPGPHQLFAEQKQPPKTFENAQAEFVVARPFFQYPALRYRYPVTDRYDSPVAPYLLKLVNGQWVAVFGVVDATLKEHIGLLNYSWRNEHPELDTQVTVADPVRSLEQVFELCNADPACQGARKILLAQMPFEQAHLLAGKFEGKFELVIAQTDDRHASPDQTRTQDDSSPIVLAPGQIYEKRDIDLNVGVYKAELSHVASGGKLTLTLTSHRRKVEIGPSGAQAVYLPAADKVKAMLQATFKKMTTTPSQLRMRVRFQSKDYSRENFREIALEAMREKYGADVALLQARDVFELPHSITPRDLSLQEVMDTIFWKGDFVIRLDVTGATLKALMARSKQFDQEDSDSLDSTLETGRGLLPLGLKQDPEKNWFVDGEKVDDGKLYSVATTDYLAFGDTGYTEFRSANVPRVPDLKTLVPLSGLVCGTLDASDSSCDKVDLQARRYFDSLDMQPLVSLALATPFDDLHKWATHLGPGQDPSGGPKSRESQVQNRPLWSVTLEKADINYSSYHHSPASQRTLRSEFAGIPQSQVLTPNSIAIGNDYRLRVSRAGRRFEEFLLSEEAYEHDTKQGNDDTNVPSQANNMLAGEGGINFRILPDRKALSAFKLLASVRVQTNPFDPLTPFNLHTGQTLVRPIDRLTTLPFKTGLRYETETSWLEVGYQISRNIGSPIGYQFFDPKTQALLATCSATAAVKANSLGTCIDQKSGGDPAWPTPITPASQVVAITRTRKQQGTFLNLKIQVPLFHQGSNSIQYVMENTGNFYFHSHDDVALDPRYLDIWAHSLPIKLIGNISLVPKIQFLFYKNMVDNNSMRSISTSIGLQYNFKWHTGMLLKDALLYADPSLKPSGKP